MKRDMDLIRRIVLATADLPQYAQLQQLAGVDEREFVMHVAWLEEAGLVKANVRVGMSESDGQYAFVWRLTWAGCEFADAVRSDTIWKKAKETVIKPSASWTFDLLKEWLKTEISQGLPTLGRLGQ
ncbi:DUF2513 domain-containing protein [Ottowia sp. GY511]|uniref:DUF2513 domain-containing protein n=1 Tax=Ottowia flava TaxID=2675430 RepID=A0ABW4KPA1_9BURK|nr:DUF2513 domain-containing protein [Ottowia sp. GY511]TXK26387.1 DUF2513 domain-containing protein [Ottowia sp. GY511]